ncbi:MAG: YceI family protein [Micromonosporaceae bacterium]
MRRSRFARRVPPARLRRRHHGDLTLRGKTRPVTFRLTAEREAGTIKLAGSIPILFADWDIPNPSFAGLVTTQDHGTLEFLVILGRS